MTRRIGCVWSCVAAMACRQQCQKAGAHVSIYLEENLVYEYMYHCISVQFEFAQVCSGMQKQLQLTRGNLTNHYVCHEYAHFPRHE